jgi:hypothetical protein
MQSITVMAGGKPVPCVYGSVWDTVAISGDGQLPPKLKRMALQCRCDRSEDMNKKIMELARRLKALPKLPDTPALKAMLWFWNDANRFKVSPKRIGELVQRIRRLCRDVVNRPIGEVMTGLAFSARTAVLEGRIPQCAEPYRDKPETVLLVVLSKVLADHAGGHAFPLSVRTAAEATGTSKGDAERALNRLRADGVLERVVRGMVGPKSKIASTFRYRGD